MPEHETSSVIPVILSGGSGTRLWPLSRSGRPKQMLALTGDETMLRQTARRVGDPRLYRAPLVVASEDQAGSVEAALEGVARLILEPCARNTAPAIALAALAVAPEDVILVLPSDHLIRDVEGFGAAVRGGFPFAREGWIVTFGMTPDSPETGYGYIRRGDPIGEGIWAVDRFVEKPDAAAAANYLSQGGYDWNGGLFLMRAGTLIDGLARHAPEILDAARRAWSSRREEGRVVRPDPYAFAEAPSLSIDYALMEKAERIAVIPVSVGWSDVGSWAALHALADKDDSGNALTGDVIAIDTAGCLIRSDGPLVAALGVKDLVVVATRDAVVVIPRDRSQEVKTIVERLNREGREKWT